MQRLYHHALRGSNHCFLLLFLILTGLTINASAMLCPFCQSDYMEAFQENRFLCTHCLMSMTHDPTKQHCICPHCIRDALEKNLPISQETQRHLTIAGAVASGGLLLLGLQRNSLLFASPFPFLTAYLGPKLLNDFSLACRENDLKEHLEENCPNPYHQKKALLELESRLTLQKKQPCSYLGDKAWRDEFISAMRTSAPGAFNHGRGLAAMIYTWNHSNDVFTPPSPSSISYQYIKPFVYTNDDVALPSTVNDSNHLHHSQQSWHFSSDSLNECNDTEETTDTYSTGGLLQILNGLEHQRRLIIQVCPGIMLGIHTQSNNNYVVYNPVTGIFQIDSTNFITYIKGLCKIQKAETFTVETMPTLAFPND